MPRTIEATAFPDFGAAGATTPGGDPAGGAVAVGGTGGGSGCGVAE